MFRVSSFYRENSTQNSSFLSYAHFRRDHVISIEWKHLHWWHEKHNAGTYEHHQIQNVVLLANWIRNAVLLEDFAHTSQRCCAAIGDVDVEQGRLYSHSIQQLWTYHRECELVFWGVFGFATGPLHHPYTKKCRKKRRKSEKWRETFTFPSLFRMSTFVDCFRHLSTDAEYRFESSVVP